MAMKSYCTPEEWAWLEERYPTTSVNELLPMFEAKFGHVIPRNAIYCHMCDKGLKRKVTRVRWDAEKDAFLRGFIPGHTEDEIREAFADRFGITLTESQIGNSKTRLGVKSGTKGGQFRKGQTPPNKGKTWDEIGLSEEARARSLATCFKKGNMPHTAEGKPIGYERVSRDGYVEVKIAERPSHQACNDNFRMKHHIVYEQHHGEIPEGCNVVFADHDRRNFDPDNLVAIPRGIWSIINNYTMGYWDRESLEIAMLRAEVIRKRRELELAPRPCKRCGVKFKARYPHQRTCDTCLGREETK